MSLVFFFKQKTAYEMRISDWSSDVCSSDLLKGPLRGLQRHGVKVPVDVVDTIVGPLHDLMVTSPSVHPFFRNEDVRAASATALAAVRPSAISDTELWDLMHGNADQRAAAIEVVARKESVSRNDTFVAMSRDSDSWVSAVIANQVARTTARKST